MDGRPRPSAGWVVWLVVATMLLRAALPMLARGSAEVQGVALVEVCSVYGVAMVPLDGHPRAPKHGPHGAPDHAVDHCALNALAAMAPPVLPIGIAPLARGWHDASPCWRSPVQAPDACALWVARLKHGPPLTT